MIDDVAGDLRYAVRLLRKSPGFTLVAVLSLALGVGANAAMFGVVRTLLLTPLPVEAPEELALVAWQREGSLGISQTGSTNYPDPSTGVSLRSNLSSPAYRALRDAAPAGVDLFAFAFLRDVSVGYGDGAPVLAGAVLADGGYFGGLGVPMALGRGITPADDSPGAPLVAVLGHGFWQRTFGGDPSIVGRVVRVNGQPAEVVGVTAPGFVGLSAGGFFPQTDVTLPVSAQPLVVPDMNQDGVALAEVDRVFWLRGMARIPAGVDRDETRAALARAFDETTASVFESPEGPVVLALVDGSQGAQPLRPETARLLYMLLVVVAMVLLIACVNLASLMLARGVSRQREMAVRRALGGARTRLVRQGLAESLVLAVAGTGFGLALAWASRGLLADLLAGSVGAGAFRPAELAVRLDPVVLAVAVAAGLGTTVLFGLLPALRLSRLDPMTWLRKRTVGGDAPALSAGRGLIALQVAVSLPLVIGAALFLRTMANLGQVELGFDPGRLVVFQVDPTLTDRPDAEHPRLYREALAEVAAVPGVREVSLVSHALLGGITSNGSVEVGGERAMMYFNAVGPGFTQTLGIALVAGRMLGLQDGPDAPPVAVVNQTAVRETFGGESPVGRIVRRGQRDVQIVGVVGDTPYRNLRDPVPPVLHESALQVSGYGGHHVVLRYDGPPATVEAGVREAMRRVEAALPVPEFRHQGALIEASGARERAFTRLLSLFGAFALLLAGVGLHGVTAYSVNRRTGEIGVRLAVGAGPRDIVRMILRQVVLLAAIGLLLGVPLALAGGPVVGSLLYGVAPTDPATLVVAAGALLAVAVAAGLFPAFRAARTDPLTALRSE
ncbi:MAG: ABC transporter permease [Longimicrobiales bacterium]